METWQDTVEGLKKTTRWGETRASRRVICSLLRAHWSFLVFRSLRHTICPFHSFAFSCFSSWCSAEDESRASAVYSAVIQANGKQIAGPARWKKIDYRYLVTKHTRACACGEKRRAQAGSVDWTITGRRGMDRRVPTSVWLSLGSVNADIYQ